MVFRRSRGFALHRAVITAARFAQELQSVFVPAFKSIGLYQCNSCLPQHVGKILTGQVAGRGSKTSITVFVPRCRNVVHINRQPLLKVVLFLFRDRRKHPDDHIRSSEPPLELRKSLGFFYLITNQTVEIPSMLARSAHDRFDRYTTVMIRIDRLFILIS